MASHVVSDNVRIPSTNPPRTITAVIVLGGLVLGILTLSLTTWLAIVYAKGEPTLATLRSIDRQIWRHLHNQSIGVEWVALSDWGQDLVNEGPFVYKILSPIGKRDPFNTD